MNHPSILESRENTFKPFPYGFNNFSCIPSFSLRVYLVLGKSENEKQFSLQTDMYCGFSRNCW